MLWGARPLTRGGPNKLPRNLRGSTSRQREMASNSGSERTILKHLANIDRSAAVLRPPRYVGGVDANAVNEGLLRA
jgi:hypothetical protein